MKFKMRKDSEEKSKLYFLISLLLVLFISLIFIENKTYYTIEKSDSNRFILNASEFKEDEVFSDFIEVKEKKMNKKETVSAHQPPEKSENTVEENIEDEIDPIDLSDLFVHSSESNSVLGVEDIDDLPHVEKIASVPYASVSNAPIFKGCEMLNTKEDQKACMNNKIAHIVSKRLSSHLSKNDDGVRIYVQFTVNEIGQVVEVKTNSNSESLNYKTKQIIENLPNFQPAEHNGQKVQVLYSLPIFVKIN